METSQSMAPSRSSSKALPIVLTGIITALVFGGGGYYIASSIASQSLANQVAAQKAGFEQERDTLNSQVEMLTESIQNLEQINVTLQEDRKNFESSLVGSGFRYGVDFEKRDDTWLIYTNLQPIELQSTFTSMLDDNELVYSVIEDYQTAGDVFISTYVYEVNEADDSYAVSNHIYRYTIMTGDFEEIYARDFTDNGVPVIELVGIEGDNLIIFDTDIDFSPHPCYQLLGHNGSLQYLDTGSSAPVLVDYVIPSSILERAQYFERVCEDKINI